MTVHIDLFAIGMIALVMLVIGMILGASLSRSRW